MSFAPGREHLLFQRTVRRFAEGVLRPAAADADEAGRFGPTVLAQVAQTGLFGLLVPRPLGGAGVDTLRWVLALEAVAHASAAMASILIAHGVLACWPFARTAPAHADPLLSRLARGEALAGGHWPPHAVTAGAPLPTATREATGTWRLHGALNRLHNAPTASTYVLWARTAPDAVLALFVGAPGPGLTIGPPRDELGRRGAPAAPAILDGYTLGGEALLAHGAEASTLAAELRDLHRLSVAAQALGIAQAALDAATHYAGTRQQFGQLIGRFQGLRWLLADLHLAVEGARLLVYRAAALRDAGEPFGPVAALARLAAGQTATRVATKAVQVHGGYGYLRESPVQRYLRDAKSTELAGDTSATLRDDIARALLPLDA